MRRDTTAPLFPEARSIKAFNTLKGYFNERRTCYVYFRFLLFEYRFGIYRISFFSMIRSLFNYTRVVAAAPITGRVKTFRSVSILNVRAAFLLISIIMAQW